MSAKLVPRTASTEIRVSVPTEASPVTVPAVMSGATATPLLLVVAVTVVTALVTYTVRINPLWIFAGAALLGLGGLM